MATFVLGAVIAALLALALRHVWKNRTGCSCWAAGGGCGGSCGNCGQCRKE